MARSPRQPKGPPLEDLWLQDRATARKFLRGTWEEWQIRSLTTAGDLGMRAARAIKLLVPYEIVVTGKRGVSRSRAPRAGAEDPTIRALRRRGSRDVVDEVQDPVGRHRALITLDKIADDAVRFVKTYDTLRQHADRLQRSLEVQPILKQRLSGMRQPRQMFCACVLITAEQMKLPEPTSGQLAALALQVESDEFKSESATNARATARRERAWEALKRKVKKRLVGAVRALDQVSLEHLQEPPGS